MVIHSPVDALEIALAARSSALATSAEEASLLGPYSALPLAIFWLVAPPVSTLAFLSWLLLTAPHGNLAGA